MQQEFNQNQKRDTQKITQEVPQTPDKEEMDRQLKDYFHKLDIEFDSQDDVGDYNDAIDRSSTNPENELAEDEREKQKIEERIRQQLQFLNKGMSSAKKIRELNLRIAEFQKKYETEIQKRRSVQKQIDKFEDVIQQKIRIFDQKGKQEKMQELTATNRKLKNDIQIFDSSYQTLKIQFDQLKSANQNLEKKNQALREYLLKVEAALKTSGQRCVQLRKHVESKLSHATSEIESIEKSFFFISPFFVCILIQVFRNLFRNVN